MPRLVSICAVTLADALSVDNAGDTLTLAAQHGAVELRDSALRCFLPSPRFCHCGHPRLGASPGVPPGAGGRGTVRGCRRADAAVDVTPHDVGTSGAGGVSAHPPTHGSKSSCHFDRGGSCTAGGALGTDPRECWTHRRDLRAEPGQKCWLIGSTPSPLVTSQCAARLRSCCPPPWPRAAAAAVTAATSPPL